MCRMKPEEATPFETQNPDSPAPEAPVVPQKATNDPTSLYTKRAIDFNRVSEEFGTGVAASLVVNAVIFTLYGGSLVYAGSEGMLGARLDNRFMLLYGLSVLLINIAVVSVLARTRREFVKGFIAGYALMFFAAVFLGIFLSAACLDYITTVHSSARR